MNKQQVRDLAERAAWTFAQTFVATWAVSNFKLDKVTLVASAAAGLSALKTWVKETL